MLLLAFLVLFLIWNPVFSYCFKYQSIAKMQRLNLFIVAGSQIYSGAFCKLRGVERLDRFEKKTQNMAGFRCFKKD